MSRFLLGYSAFCGIYSSITYNTIDYKKNKYEFDIVRGVTNMVIGPLITPYCLVYFLNDTVNHGITNWRPDIRKKWSNYSHPRDFSILPLFYFDHNIYLNRRPEGPFY